jgi:hypothetical protein
MCIIWSDLKCNGNATIQVLEIIFEVQMKRSNEKIKRKKKGLSNLLKAFYIILFPFYTPQIS